MDEATGLILSKLEEMNARITEMDARIDGRFKRIEAELSSIRITIEQDLNKKIDVIGEGHDFLKNGIEDARKMESKREVMELQIINLGMDVKKIKEHLSLA